VYAVIDNWRLIEDGNQGLGLADVDSRLLQNVNIYQSTRRHNQRNLELHQHCSENRKNHTLLVRVKVEP
jgi:hypothetical protein